MGEIVIGNGKITAEGVTIEVAMLSAGEYPDAFLYLYNGKPVPMTAVIGKEMIIEALRVASGG